MMCWSWIDSSRKREALTISCPGPGIASLRRCKAGPGQKIAKTTPCKVEWTPARSTLAALRPGQEKKGPNLISSRSIILFEHDLFGKPVPTFPDHALLLRRAASLRASVRISARPNTGRPFQAHVCRPGGRECVPEMPSPWDAPDRVHRAR